MNELERAIVERIRAQGPLPFAAFMSLALYHPVHGYYARGAPRTGWRGHFLTSPELDPAFGQLWGRAFRSVWQRCGSPDDFQIVEVGAGEGGFAAAVLTALEGDFADTVTYRIVERVPGVRRRQQKRLDEATRVQWTDSITDLPAIDHGIVFANEVLDNLPVHLVSTDGKSLREVCVDAGHDGLKFVNLPPSNPELERWVERTGTVPEPGTRIEVTLAAESFVTHLARCLGTGTIFLVDYGAEGPELARRGGTLLAYSDSGADERVLEEVGERDITAHANWTSVTGAMAHSHLTVEGPTEQRAVLIEFGARELDRSLRDEHDAALADGRGSDAVRTLSRRQALGALLDPGGLGGLQVVSGSTKPA